MIEPVERRWTTADGVALFARDYPGAAGPPRLPAVCVHGLTRNGRDFEDVAPAIAATGRRVIVPDVRGRGESARDPDPLRYLLETYVADLADLLDRLGVARAVFIGTSMGGLITMGLAEQRPEMVASAVLNDIGPEVDPNGIARLMTYVGKPVQARDWSAAAEAIRTINGAAFPDYGDEDWLRFARRTFRETPDGVVLDYDLDILAPFAAGKFKAEPERAWQQLRALGEKPLLAIRGGMSDLLTAEILDRMRSAVPTIETAEIPNVGHAPMLTEPAAMQALLAFLEKVD